MSSLGYRDSEVIARHQRRRVALDEPPVSVDPDERRDWAQTVAYHGCIGCTRGVLGVVVLVAGAIQIAAVWRIMADLPTLMTST